MMLGSLMNVTTVRISRITAAPDGPADLELGVAVRLVRDRVLLGAEAEHRDEQRGLDATNTIAATISTITYSVWIEFAFGDPPDFGVRQFAKRVRGEDQAGRR